MPPGLCSTFPTFVSRLRAFNYPCSVLTLSIFAEANRNELVEAGAIPILNNILTSTDWDVQYYCAAVVSNIAFTQRHRTMIIGIGEYDVVRKLINLLRSSNERVSCPDYQHIYLFYLKFF
jgi:hypothetical protein